jgi:hypothetical protein
VDVVSEKFIPKPTNQRFLKCSFTAKISGCSFGSTLPASIGNWTALQLFSAHNNKFTGPLPGTMEQWSRLKTFNVSGNQLTGTLPNGISQWAEVEEVCVCVCSSIV